MDQPKIAVLYRAAVLPREYRSRTTKESVCHVPSKLVSHATTHHTVLEMALLASLTSHIGLVSMSSKIHVQYRTSPPRVHAVLTVQTPQVNQARCTPSSSWTEFLDGHRTFRSTALRLRTTERSNTARVEIPID